MLILSNFGTLKKKEKEQLQFVVHDLESVVYWDRNYFSIKVIKQ